MKNITLLASLALGAGLALSAISTQAAVVYSNYGNDLGINFNPGTSEVGDEVVMNISGAPGQNQVSLTRFQFNAWASGYTGNPSINAQVRFYANDGPLIGLAASPSTPLWSSGVFPITIQTTGGGAVVPGDTTYYNIDFTTDVLGVLVPKQFTWSVQFSGLDVGTAGVQLFSPPTTGGNFTDYWLNNAGVWSLQGGSPPNYDFASSFEGVAVPEPAPMLTMACLVGVAGIVVWRKRSKASAVV